MKPSDDPWETLCALGMPSQVFLRGKARDEETKPRRLRQALRYFLILSSLQEGVLSTGAVRNDLFKPDLDGQLSRLL